MAENSGMTGFSSLSKRPWQGAAWLALALLLTGCDALGIETPGKVAEKKDAEGRAIGSACRHAVRSLEDCYASNPKASKAAIFAGWREMDEYMRENDIPGMPSQASAAPATPPAPTAAAPVEEVLNGNAAPGGNAPTGAINLPARPVIAPAR